MQFWDFQQTITFQITKIISKLKKKKKQTACAHTSARDCESGGRTVHTARMHLIWHDETKVLGPKDSLHVKN